MPIDKSTIIIEAQWMEQEIPRIEQELQQLRKMERDLLTSPMETVRLSYTSTYRAERRRAHPFYHRRRSVTPTRYGYRERMLDVGWLAVLARVLIVAAAALAVYVAYHNHQAGHTQRGIVWGSIVLVAALALAFAPALGDYLWERRARQKAESAAEQARQSPAFLQEKQERQAKLRQCRARTAEIEERLRFAHQRLDELRGQLTSTNHKEETPG